MKKIIKNNIKVFISIIISAVVFTGVGVYAAVQYTASQITYNKNGQATVDAALNDLYTKANGFCKKITGNKTTIGSEYVCDPGDGEYRVFYVLKVNDDTVELIMDRNINSGTVNHATTLAYFTTGDGKNLGWNNVSKVDNPKVQDIANAVGNTNWNVSTATTDKWFYFDKYNGNYQNSTQVAKANNRSAYGWLYSNTRECEAYGCPLNTSLDSSGAYCYWLQEKIYNNSGRAWDVDRGGRLDSNAVSNDTDSGVRPVITVLKSQLI